jgi:glycosidase
MNYPFLFATTGFVGSEGDGKPSTFMRKVLANYASYAPQVSRNMMNLIDSHDTPRILNACGGNRKLADLAAILEFAWVGAPTVYYGDELGMAGGKDPDDRRGMTWNAATSTNPTLNLYRKLMRARRTSVELQSGDPVSLIVDDASGTLAFARVLDNKAAICLVNRSNSIHKMTVNPATVGSHVKRLYNVITGDEVRPAIDGTIAITLDPLSGTILVPDAPIVSNARSGGLLDSSLRKPNWLTF